MRTRIIVTFLVLTACSGEPNVNSETETLPSSPNAPVLVEIGDQTLEEQQTLSFILEAISPDNSPVTYKLDNPPDGSLLDEVTGVFLWTPNLTQAGTYNLRFRALTFGGVDSINVLVVVTDIDTGGESGDPSSLISFGTTTFNEGEIKDKLFRITFSVEKTINYVDVVNFNSAFTILDNMAGEAIEVNTLNQSSRISFIDSNQGLDFYTELKGAVKESGTYNITFNIAYDDGSIETVNESITISSSSLPIFRYDVINVTDFGTPSVSINKIYNQVGATYRILSGSITPILEKYIEKDIPCGKDFVFQSGDSNGHQACVLNEISPDSETAIFFDSVAKGSGFVGGLSLGTRKGVLISDSSFNHTLIHELGHNFGLVHTHEVSALYNDHHSGQNWGLYDNGVFRRLTYSFDTVSFPMLEYGDGISDTGIDPLGSIYVANLNGGGGAFSSFNGSYEGEEHLLFKQNQPTDALFTDSEYICKQVFLSGVYSFECDNNTGLFDNAIINNVMSYWYKIPGDEHLTAGQKNKMLNVISSYPELF